MTGPSPRAYLGFGSTWTTLDADIAWTEVTDSVRSKEDIVTTNRGRSSELDDYRAGTGSLVLNNDDRRFDPLHETSPFYRTLLNLTGTSGSHASTPDHASLDIVGDIDIRCRVALDDWTPAGISALVAKSRVATNQIAYIFAVGTTGVLQLYWSTDGTAGGTLVTPSTAAVGAAAGATRWVRVTFDVNDGAGNRVTRFYTSTDATSDHTLVTWTQLGSTVTTAGATSIFSSTEPVELGGQEAGTANRTAGTMDAAAVLSGIAGTVVADPVFSIGLGAGATSVTDSTGKVWTVNSPASIDGVGTYLLPGVPVKVTGTPTGEAEEPVLRGFVAGWPQDYVLGNTLGVVNLQVVDGFGKLATAGTPPSVVAYEVAVDDPVAVWSMDERSGLVMADRSGNGNDGRYLNGVLGLDPLLEDGGQAASFGHVGDNRGLSTGKALVTAYPFTLEAWVKFPRNLTEHHTFIAGTRDAALGQWVWFACFASTGIPANTTGSVCLWISGGRGVRGTTAIDDDHRHQVVAVANSQTSFTLYVDGVLESMTTFEAGTGLSGTTLANHHKLWSVGNVADNTSGDYGIGGIIDNPAVYPSALSAGRVLDHYQAGTAPWDGDLTGERVGRILDIVGWPADLRDIASGNTVLGWASLGANALSLVKSMEAAEQGRLFVSRDGKLTLLDRYYHLEVSEGMTSQVTFSDDGAGTEFSGLSFDFDDRLVYNRVRGSRPGGTPIEAFDQDSIDTYGEQVDTSLNGIQVPDDVTVRNAVEYRLLRYKEPQHRVRPIELKLHGMTPAKQAQVLALELGYRVTVERTPQGVGSQRVQETIVEGIAHRIEAGGWTTTLTLSPVDTATYFTLDVSELDGADVLAY